MRNTRGSNRCKTRIQPFPHDKSNTSHLPLASQVRVVASSEDLGYLLDKCSRAAMFSQHRFQLTPLLPNLDLPQTHSMFTSQTANVRLSPGSPKTTIIMRTRQEFLSSSASSRSLQNSRQEGSVLAKRKLWTLTINIDPCTYVSFPDRATADLPTTSKVCHISIDR